MGMLKKSTSEAGERLACRWILLLCVGLAVSSAAMMMTAPGPILTKIAASLDINIGSATHLMTAYVLANAFCLTWGGIICDRFGLTAALAAGLLCTCVPAVIMTSDMARQYNILFVLRLIQGAAPGIIFATVGRVLALWFQEEERGVAGGLMIGATPIGASIGVISSPIILEVVGDWQRTMALLSIPGWAGIVLALLFTRGPEKSLSLKPVVRVTGSDDVQMTFSDALKLPHTWIGAGVMFCNAWCLFGLYNLIPSFLATESPVGAGLSSVMAGKLSLVMIFVGFVSMTAGGLFFDKLAKGNYRTAIIIGFLMTGASAFLITMQIVYMKIPLLVVCLLTAGWGIPFMNASIGALIVNYYPASIVGRMMGFWFGIGTFGGAVAIFLGGISITETGNFRWAVMPISMAAVAGVLVSTFLRFGSRNAAYRPKSANQQLS